MPYIKRIAGVFMALGLSLVSFNDVYEKAYIPEESVESLEVYEEVEEFLFPDEEQKEQEPPADVLLTAKIAAVGDLMVHQWQLDDAYDPATKEYDFSNDFEMVSEYLSSADFTVGNLETVLGGKEIGYSDYPMFNTPDSFAYAIKEAGFDLLSTANNHSMDKREAGLLRTLDVLDSLGIEHVGTYRSPEERENYTIVDINGINVAFLSYTYGTNGIPVPKSHLVNLLDENLIISDLKKVQALEPDMIIVMPHMGDEYALTPRQHFKNWAGLMIDYGADIVLASHPHVLQPMEMVRRVQDDGTVRRGFVIYSLGNFISSQRTEPRDAGIILNIEISKLNDEKAQIDRVSFIPTWVQFRNQAGHDYVRVLSVYDALSDYENGIENQLRPADIKRLKRVHDETVKIYLEKPPSLEYMRKEYIFYDREISIQNVS